MFYLRCWLQPNPLFLSLGSFNNNGSSLIKCPHNLGSNTSKVAVLLFSTKVHPLIHRLYANAKRLRFHI
jgi:hypothetical protein